MIGRWQQPRRPSPSHLLARLLVGGFITWRLSRLLVKEDGPFSIFDDLRRVTGIEYASIPDSDEKKVIDYPGWNPLHCMYCTSLWVGFAMTQSVSWGFAVSGMALIINMLHDWLEREVKVEVTVVNNGPSKR